MTEKKERLTHAHLKCETPLLTAGWKIASWINYFHSKDLFSVLLIQCSQDVVLLQYNEEWFKKNRLVAWAREKLKLHGIIGLNEARFFCELLKRLPTMLQQQYLYEKVLYTSLNSHLVISSAFIKA